jgi:hypothetical protein
MQMSLATTARETRAVGGASTILAAALRSAVRATPESSSAIRLVHGHGGVMSFLKSLFGRLSAGVAGGDAEAAPGAPVRSIEYAGFIIHATPFKREGQYQTAGAIEKEIDGVMKKHEFIRAERLASLDEAVEFALLKGRQIVDLQGERLFR